MGRPQTGRRARLEMVSPSALRSTPSLVPSPSVLRYLRAQSKRTSCCCAGRTWTCFAGLHSASSPRRSFHLHKCRNQTSDVDATRCYLGENDAVAQSTDSKSYAPSIFDMIKRPCPPQWQMRQHRPSPSASRLFSTSSRKHLPTIRQLLGLNPKTPPAHICPSDLPPRTWPVEDGGLFNFPRIAAKAINEPRLRCTELDEHGNVTLVNGEFKKTELIAKVRSYLVAPI